MFFFILFSSPHMCFEFKDFFYSRPTWFLSLKKKYNYFCFYHSLPTYMVLSSESS